MGDCTRSMDSLLPSAIRASGLLQPYWRGRSYNYLLRTAGTQRCHHPLGANGRHSETRELFGSVETCTPSWLRPGSIREAALSKLSLTLL